MRFVMRFVRRHRQAWKISLNQLSSSPIATLLVFAVIGIALALPMGLYVALKNVQTITQNIHASAQMSLYLNLNTPEPQIAHLVQTLRLDNDIENVIYISADQGLKDFQQQYGFGNALAELKTNPLPPVIMIEPAINLRTGAELAALQARLEKLPNVHLAQLNMVWLQRLNAMILVGQRVFYALAFLFGLVVLLVIGNTIKLTTQNALDEIIVIKLLGGSNRFIARPFLYSGFIYGLAGGIFAWLFVDGMMWWLQSPINYLAQLYNSTFHVEGFDVSSTLTLLVTSTALGYIASWFVVHRYINAIEPK
ncbi:MAG: hypothetical protein A2103_00730 [Gammaproteobacteria bacterium GWF2_41_13]|nr:MAG: hypothetical protein A2103_00730 [Gammaproteobacteria bacterium GWF2_41_13]